VGRLRVACIGSGFIAGRHLAALAGFPELKIVAVADPLVDRAEHTAARFGARAYDDGLALLAAEELDAVWLCVPPFAHGSLERAAVERGVAFFVEKPLALDVPTAAEIATRVADRGLLTAVGYHWRSLDVVAQTLRLLRDDPPQLVLGQWLDATPVAPWWSQRNGSGGQLLEQSTHLFDLVRLLCGEVLSVCAAEARMDRLRWPEADIPTASSVLLRLRSGAVGSISSSCLLDGRYFVGLRLVAQGRVVEVRERALSDHELHVDGQQVARSDQDPIATEDRGFVDALLGRAEPRLAAYDEALRTHALVCAADRSARDGLPVILGQDPA
jgi:myo-inositol 2-dehydrogenase/D-chiro-inositol 1-dehydrogenase